MKELKRILSHIIPKNKTCLLPSGFQAIGDIIILNLKPGLQEYEKQIGQAIIRSMPRIKTVAVKYSTVKGELRLPQIKPIAGNGTVTTHRENRCKYKLDVAKVMFAKGNVKERARLPRLVKPGETIVDMFAGIGYFSLPIAIHSNPRKIIAIEKNPDSVHYLNENIILNRIHNVEVIEGDNRDTDIENVADRVIMGYLPKTEKFLPTAVNFLKEKGTIHFHNTYKNSELWERPINELEKAAIDAGYKMDKISRKVVVKHFAPGVEHIVIDAEFKQVS